MNKDNRDVLGRLIREELEDSGRGPVAVTSGWSESNVRSFYGWKDGATIPLQRSRGMLEDAASMLRSVAAARARYAVRVSRFMWIILGSGSQLNGADD